MNYFEFYPGDYLRDTLDLSAAEHGIYLMLICAYYSSEAPLPNHVQKLSRMCRLTGRLERRFLDTILTRFFVLETDGYWHHGRIDAELLKARKRIDIARKNGKKGGRPSLESENPAGNPAGYPRVSVGKPRRNPEKTQPGEALHTPHAISKTEQEQTSLVLNGRNPAGSRFEEFWSAYPCKQGKKVARATWDRRKLDHLADQIIADIAERKCSDAKWRDGFIPMASTYVNQERWQDAIQPERNTNGNHPPSKTRQGVESLMRGVNGYGTESNSLARSDSASWTEQALLPKPGKNASD